MTITDSRRRIDFKEVPAIYYAYYNGSQHDVHPFQRWTSYHYMVDQINPIVSGKGYRRPGFCQHLKIDKTYIAPSLVYVNKVNNDSVQEFAPDAWDGQSPTGLNTDPLDFGYSNLMIDFFKTPRFSGLCLEAWNKLKTQVPTSVSLLNFIYELKDFKELGKSLSGAYKVVNGKSTGKVITAPFKGKRTGKKLHQGAKAVNDTFLSYNFMWAPFVGDLVKLTQLADTVAKRMAFLRASRGKVVTIRFTKPDCYINDALGADSVFSESNDWKRYFKLIKYQCDFNVTAKLYQNLDGLDDAWADLRATIATLGINNPLKAAWNAIPFSFLVDWIGPFGSFLERAAVQPFYGTWDVFDITTSVRERGTIECHRLAKPSGNVIGSDELVTRTNIDRYIRLVGLPQTLGAFDFTQLTQQQQKLFLSLVLTKVL